MSSESPESNEKRLILFTVVTVLSIFAIKNLMDLTGLTPPPPKEPPPAAVAQARPEEGKEKAREKEEEKQKEVAKEKESPLEPVVALAKPEELVIGSLEKPGKDGYRLQVSLDQKGAGVASVDSAVYEAEFEEGKPRHRPLTLLKYDPLVPTSLSMSLIMPRDPSVNPDEAAAAGVAAVGGGEVPLDRSEWKVDRDEQGRVVQSATRETPTKAEGQQIVFRTRVESLGLDLIKTYRIFKGDDGFEVALTFESPSKTQSIVYKLLGPHGIPIEGEWYTGTFRDAIFGLIKGSSIDVKTLSAYDIAKRGKENPERFQQHPLRYAGIENQYFASVIEPVPAPTGPDDRWDSEAVPVILHDDIENRQKADIGVEITSRPVEIGPNVPKTHTYRVFAGAKTVEALTAFAAEDLAKYRKNNWIPFASDIAKSVISPGLDIIYNFTAFIARSFGGSRGGNYGVAIILLTMTVRMLMFPLGRKQAMSAKKMQDLQPLLKQIQEKYKDDKEVQTKETWALYKRHGVNPVGGCLPALIQLPIFVGLWQALNNSVHLRHASFLYIENLAAPDMLFKFPTTLPFLGDYFNILPFIVVALMLVQTKLFSPPATTPEAEAQQKMMKYMMIFMAFMFYKVPSGLGLYFITSSIWQISERLLLPKITHAPATTVTDDDKTPPGGGGGGNNNNNGGGGRGGNNGPAKPLGRFDQLRDKFDKFKEKVLEEAQKDSTYRKLTEEKDRDDRDRDRPGGGRDKGKPRAKPDRRR